MLHTKFRENRPAGSTAPIAQWLERRPSNPAVVRSNLGGDGHICACHMGSIVPPGK